MIVILGLTIGACIAWSNGAGNNAIALMLLDMVVIVGTMLNGMEEVVPQPAPDQPEPEPAYRSMIPLTPRRRPRLEFRQRIPYQEQAERERPLPTFAELWAQRTWAAHNEERGYFEADGTWTDQFGL